jgi:CCR4-NOT transcriptional regulation complex NOT5 subunit
MIDANAPSTDSTHPSSATSSMQFFLSAGYYFNTSSESASSSIVPKKSDTSIATSTIAALSRINAQIGTQIDNPFVPTWLKEVYAQADSGAEQGNNVFDTLAMYKELIAVTFASIVVLWLTFKVASSMK